MKNWKQLADKKIIEKTIENLRANNINAVFVKTGKDAKEMVLQMIPKGTAVLIGQSKTLEEIGLASEIEESAKFMSVRKEYMSLDHEKDSLRIRELRTAPEMIIGSVHAVTENGEVLIASNTGSQLAAYAYGAGKVIWVIGAQKIVKDLNEGNMRIYDYVLELESERLKKLYGIPSNVSKLLIFNKEPAKDRVTTIIVNEPLGF